MADAKRELPSQEFIEQKITKQVTILAGATGNVSIDIPREKTVFLKGYGYTWFTTNTYKLNTGNTGFPKRTDQEGSPAIPALFGTPFKARSGGKIQLSIINGDSADHTYDVVFYIVSNELLDEESTGGDLNLTIGGTAGLASSVALTDSTGTTYAPVTALGLGTNPAAPITLLSGSKSATGTASALATSTACKRVTIRANSANTASVLIGNATSQTFELFTGESMDLEISNLSAIFVKSSSGTQAVNYIGA